jgi:DNA-binding response OmpR family regulator
MNPKILVVEDEKDLARAIRAILEFSKYSVTVAYNGQEALDEVKKQKFDVILMDVMMPIMDGITALKEMRKTGINTPIIMLTAKSQIDDKVEGLDSGANDYLTKPFDKKELLARIRALTRNSEEEKEKFVIGNITFSKENSELYNDKMVLKLNKEECDIMEILAKNSERSIFKEELCSRIFEDSNTDNNEALNKYMSFLKDKFEALGSDSIIDESNGYIIKRNISL